MLNNFKVLICDDSILARKQLKDIISTLGNPTFIEASDGQDAIDKYKANKPDMVFLDIVMPKKDGNIVISEIIEYDPNATIIPLQLEHNPSSNVPFRQELRILSRNLLISSSLLMLLRNILKGDK